MHNIQTQDAPLASTAYDALRAYFDATGHRPWREQWGALADLLSHYNKAADRELEPALYLSAIPPGTGKSTAIRAFAAALMDDARYSGRGMLIACNQVLDVEDMATQLATHRSKLCVIVAERHTEVIALGAHREANDAQVVIATQASLRQSLRGGTEFPEATRFHYRGMKRDVIAWDESFVFNRPVVLDVDAVTTVTHHLRDQSPEAVAALVEWRVVLETAPAGTCAVPDFEALGVDFRRLEDDAQDNEQAAAVAKALAGLSGGCGYLSRAGNGGAILTHIREVPDSVMPVIVTDASGARGVHPTAYDQMGTSRPVIRLREATKTYKNLTIRLINRAASRSTFWGKKKVNVRDHIDMVVRYARSVAPDGVLIVSYGKAGSMSGVAERTIAEAIQSRLTDDERSRVCYVTWGRHTATNAHIDTRRVLILGLNFMAPSAHHAAAGAALDMPMRTDDPDQHPTPAPAQVRDMAGGMLRESTFQALLRGHARRSDDGDCGVMEAVIVQSRQTGIQIDRYRAMFPGATVGYDDALLPEVPLRGHLARLAELVMTKKAEGCLEIAYTALRAGMGMKPPAFTKLLKNAQWQQWVQANGVHPCKLKGNALGLRFSPA